MIGAIAASVVFIILFILAYHYFRGFQPASDIQESPSSKMDVVDPDKPRVIFFQALWCPHSRKALGEWRSFKELARTHTQGGKELEFMSVDGEAEPTKLSRQGVEAFPTVVLENSDQIVVYDHRVTAAGLRRWLIQTLGPEGSKLSSS